MEHAVNGRRSPIEKLTFLLECAEGSAVCPIERLAFLLEHTVVGRRSPIERSAGIHVKRIFPPRQTNRQTFLLEHAEWSRRSPIERLPRTDVRNKCQNKALCLSADRGFSKKSYRGLAPCRTFHGRSLKARWINERLSPGMAGRGLLAGPQTAAVASSRAGQFVGRHGPKGPGALAHPARPPLERDPARRSASIGQQIGAVHLHQRGDLRLGQRGEQPSGVFLLRRPAMIKEGRGKVWVRPLLLANSKK